MCCLHQANPATDERSSLRQRIEQSRLIEQELLLAPAFFSALPQMIETIAGVDIQLKRGRYANELSRYRYDVVLHKRPSNPRSLAQAPQLHWARDIVEIDALRTLLITERPARLRIMSVPNARLALEIEAMQALENGGDIGAIQQRLVAGNAPAIGLEPEDFYALGELLGYWVGATWSGRDADACMDIVFVQANEMTQVMPTDFTQSSLFAYTNQPTSLDQLADMRRYAAKQLPEYMVPAAFVRLDALPLTQNGKLDRRALPVPDDAAFARQAYEAPQGELEVKLAAIWSELLSVRKIGRHDSFFALGGHSLIAIQMIERLRRLGLTVSARTLFDTPTLSVLAQSLGQDQAVATPSNLITIDTTALTPDMLPLIDLSQADIDQIVEKTPGGVILII
ncbi:hypothetical protein CPC16_000658 [Podila verticillata]|nr:hypothetical protein CPC16_000658 [Podila verticillata]